MSGAELIAAGAWGVVSRWARRLAPPLGCWVCIWLDRNGYQLPGTQPEDNYATAPGSGTGREVQGTWRCVEGNSSASGNPLWKTPNEG